MCFANGAGGRLLIGIEDREHLPPAGQVVPPEVLDRIRRRVGELTVKVQALPSLQRAANGGEYIALVIERAPGVASTRDGRYFLRLAHYGLTAGNTFTRLGVLLLGTTADRRALGTAPLVQAIKYDEQGQKINKWVWDDCELSPVELVDAIWREVPDFRESYEVAEGLYRRSVPAYDEKVVRELLVNALGHRPYTQQGDIYLNLHPERLEVVNPGRLPLGVTPRNMLHASRRRNEALARVFHDLGLMEREGSGFDLIYDRLLSQGRPAPVTEEGADWVRVTIQRRVAKPAVMRLVS